MTPRFLYEQYNEHTTKARRFLKTDNPSSARYHFLKGAEYLLKLTRVTDDDDLQSVRHTNAKKLIKLAKSIDTGSSRAETLAGAGEGKDASHSIEKDWALTESPSVTFSDVAGLEHVKEKIKVRMIYPFTHPEKAEKYRIEKGGGLLLYGPPGTGKTLIARATAGELDATFFAITPGEILSKYVGEAEKNIEALFDEARACERSVIFLDEVESLLPERRSSRSPVMQRVVPQILSELDGFEGFDPDRGMLFIGATNEPWAMDYASLRPGRFDEMLYVPLPDREARKKIIRMNLDHVPVSDEVQLDHLATQLDGYSGADIAHFCRLVREVTFQEEIEDEREQLVKPEIFETVLDDFSPSVGREDLEKFNHFREKINESHQTDSS